MNKITLYHGEYHRRRPVIEVSVGDIFVCGMSTYFVLDIFPDVKSIKVMDMEYGIIESWNSEEWAPQAYLIASADGGSDEPG